MSRERAHLRLTTMVRRRLEEDVVARVAGGEFALDYGRAVVVFPFGLPGAVGEGKVVDEGAVNDDAFAAAGVEGVLGHKGPAVLAGAVFEECLEGRADGGFVSDAEAGKLVKGCVVGFDGLVGGFEVWGGAWARWVSSVAASSTAV